MKKYNNLDEFFMDLDTSKRLQVDEIGKLIQSTEPRLVEHLKWNAPSYVLDGEDRITFNVMNKQGVVKLVLHMGATRKEDKKVAPIMQDETGMIEWSSDIRGMITFGAYVDVSAQSASIRKIIKDWLSIPASV